MSEETGSLAGQVLDDEARGVTGADVAVQGATPLTTKSDDSGRFTFNGLAPGEYVLFVGKLGYESISRKATVVAGEATDVKFELKPIPVDSGPRQETEIHNGMADGDLYTVAVTYRATYSFDVNASTGAQSIVSSMVWDANAPLLTRYFWLRLALDDASQSKNGRSPLTVRIDDLEVEKPKVKAKGSYRVDFACLLNPTDPVSYASCVAADPNAVAPAVAQQQRLTVYSTIFYHQPAPEGFTGLPS